MAYADNNSETDVLTRMTSNTSNNVDTTEGSLIYDALSPASIEVAGVYTSLDSLASEFDLSNLSGDELATRINQLTGITRNLATYAYTDFTINGNVTINIGDLFQTPNAVQFQATETATIVGSGTVNIAAVIAGSGGIIPANQITVVPVAINGITSVTNSVPTIGGYDAESDSALLERYYEKLQTPATQGNIAQFKSLAKAYSGVGDVKVFPVWNGNNTVKLVIIDSNKQVPSSDLVNTVQTDMDPLGVNWGLGSGDAPAFAFTTIAGATANTINVSFTAVKDTNYTDAQRLTNIQTSIINYLKSIAFIGSAISYAQIGSAILASAGILDYSSLTVNGNITNIPLSSTVSLCEVPILGTFTMS